MQDSGRSKLYPILNECMSYRGPRGAESSGSTVEHDINPYYREIPWSLTRQHDFPILGQAWQGKNNSNRLPYWHISLVFPYLWNFTMRIAVWIKQTQFFLFPLLLFPSHLEGIKDIISHQRYHSVHNNSEKSCYFWCNENKLSADLNTNFSNVHP